MATKKKTKKKSTRAKRTARKKATPRKTAKRPKKLTKKKAAAKRTRKKKASPKKRARKQSQRQIASPFLPKGSRSRSAGQSGDLQGLSNIAGADSESVDELLEEGNAFEADAVIGVEEAGNADEREVHTREVPEDDVPSEYLDNE